MSKSNLKSLFFRDLGKLMNPSKRISSQKAKKMGAEDEKAAT